MHVWKRISRVVGGVAGFKVRRRRLTVAVGIAALLVGPLTLSGDGEVFVLNALGIGITALMVRQFTRFGRRRGHGDR